MLFFKRYSLSFETGSLIDFEHTEEVRMVS